MHTHTHTHTHTQNHIHRSVEENRELRDKPMHLRLSSVQLSSVTKSYPIIVTPWTAAHQASQSITKSWSLLKLTSIESVMPSNHLILCHSLLLPPSIFPSIRVFSNESVLCIRWPKYWSFRVSISPSNEYSGLISFRMDWFDLLAVQGTLKVSTIGIYIQKVLWPCDVKS